MGFIRWAGLAAIASGLQAAPARAGGEDFSSSDRVYRAEKIWNRQGAGAIPAMVRAVCSSDHELAARASELLPQVGAMAVAPLLEARERGRACAPDRVESTIASVLCQAPVEARATRRLATALWWIERALASRSARRQALALDVLIEVSRNDFCDQRAKIFDATIANAAALFSRTRTVEKDRLLGALSAFGEHALPALPVALTALDDPKLRYEALGLIRAIGPGAAPAVPKLRSLLSSEWASSVSAALGAIGDPASPALPELVALLRGATAAGCRSKPSSVHFAGPVARIAALARNPGAVQALIEAFERCAADELELSHALGALGAPEAAPALMARIRDPGHSMFARLELIADLKRTNATLSPKDADFVRAVETKDSLHQRSRPGVGQGFRGTPVFTPWDRARIEMDICHQEAGIAENPPVLRELDAISLERLSSCLHDRPCGPAREQFRSTLGACCRSAFESVRPAWCGP